MAFSGCVYAICCFFAQVYAFLCDKIDIRSYGDLENWIRARPGITETRISRYINNNICRAEDTVGLLIKRRDRLETASECAKGPTRYTQNTQRPQKLQGPQKKRYR